MKILNIRNTNLPAGGFTMIEVLVSVSVFMIMFGAALQVQLNCHKIKAYNKKIEKYAYELKYVKDSILYDLSYQDVVSLCNNNKRYIDLNRSLPTNESVKYVFSNNSAGKNYIEMEVEKSEVLKINLKVCIDFYGVNKVKECEFYKGDFKR